MELNAAMLLHDLTTYGKAMVRIERISPDEVFLRSPKA